jgi:hypothetical protein
MTGRREVVRVTVLLLGAWMLAGCGADGGPGFDGNGDADAPPDVSPDRVDVPPDTPETDVPGDSGDDPDEDPAADAAGDVPTDEGGDAVSDAAGDCVARSTGVVGEACAVEADCSGVPAASDAVICFTELTVPGTTLTVPFPCGYCTAMCTSDTECGGYPNGVCAQDVFTGAIIRMCLKPCSTDSDCRDDEGYTCNDFGGYVTPALNYCAPPMPGP